MSINTRLLPCSCLASVYRGSVLSEVAFSMETLCSGAFVPEQFVIVLDGYVHESITSWLNDWSSKRGNIDLLALDRNVGLGLALRQGLAKCNHDIVIRFDTDDINAPNRLAMCFFALNANPSIHILGSYVSEFMPLSPLTACERVKSVPLSDLQIKRAMDYRNPFNHPSVAFRKSAILSIGSYEHMPYFEDYALWLKARKSNLNMQNLPETLVYVRRLAVLSRRSGFAYMIAEFTFSLQVFCLGLVSPGFLFLALFRIASRLLPSGLQLFQDYLPWRGRRKNSLHPEFMHTMSAR
jgi:cellulose synthase/poly-beta-1,6-N-acetylglucosamine synthase-like glycosyltransferase